MAVVLACTFLAAAVTAAATLAAAARSGSAPRIPRQRGALPPSPVRGELLPWSDGR